MFLGRRSVSLALSTALALAVVPASAEPGSSGRSPASATPPAEAAARDALHRADVARRDGRFADAVEAYRTALGDHRGPALPLAKRAEVIGELGLCELALGAHRDAAEHLHLSLEHRSMLSVEQERRFEAAQKEAEREVGTLFLAVSPRDAEVLLDGKSLGAPRPTHVVFVEPGPHTIRARLAGYGDATASLQAARGAPSSVTLTRAGMVPRRDLPGRVVGCARDLGHTRVVARCRALRARRCGERGDRVRQRGQRLRVLSL